MIYHNIDGTTQPSFKIGTGGVKIMSSQVKESDLLKLQKYKMDETLTKRLTVYDDEGGEHFVAYDIDLPMPKIKDIKQLDDGKTIIYFYNEDYSIREIIIDTNASGTVKSINKVTVPGNIVTYAGTDGTEIQDSGFSISDSVDISSKSIPTSNGVATFFGENILPLKTVLDGYYYIYDEDGKKYKVKLNSDGTYKYEEIN